jgi:hypothetical protein
MELLAPLDQLRKSESDRAAHHSEMGNLPSLDVSIHQRRADAKKSRSSLDIHRALQILQESTLGSSPITPVAMMRLNLGHFGVHVFG